MRRASISELPDHSTVDEHTGAVRSVQAAELCLPAQALQEMWSPIYLERLARTYWRFLTRVTLGLVRVRYTERERFLVLVARPLKLITFKAPEYELEADHGVVRWRIERGLLVARSGRGVGGHLQIDVRRLPMDQVPPTLSPTQRLRVEIEVANFHPSIASGVGRWIYDQTQSRIHVIITHAFLRSLARLNLAQSRVGRFDDERSGAGGG
jgi:hypothetical protein